MKPLRRAALAALILLALSSVTLAQDAPPQRAKFEFTAAQVLDFGTTSGVEILPPVAGYYYRVAHGTFVKRAGGTFTFSQPGHYVQVQYENAGHTAAVNFYVLGVFDQTGEASATWNPASIAAVTSSTDAVTYDIGSKGLRMGVNANLGPYGGTGADCILDLYYWLLPSDAGELDAVTTTPLP